MPIGRGHLPTAPSWVSSLDARLSLTVMKLCIRVGTVVLVTTFVAQATHGRDSMGAASRPRPALGVEKTDAPGVLSRAAIMHAAFVLAGATFPSPPISMVAFLALLDAASAAHVASASRAKGLASARSMKIEPLWTAMLALKLYVESLCSTVDAATALLLIESAGLLVGKTPMHVKPLLVATFIAATGVVHLEVNAKALIGGKTSKKTSFTWSWSTDGGQTWLPPVHTNYGTLDIPGLGPGTYHFRVFVTVGETPGAPTNPVPLTLH
jgi:hypothetical protein